MQNSVYHQGWCAYELTETTAAHIWITYSTQTEYQQVKGIWAHTPPIIKKLLANDASWERASQFSSIEWHWVHQPHSRLGLMLRTRWTTQNVLHHLLCMLSLRFGAICLFSFCLFLCFLFLSLYFKKEKECEAGWVGRREERIW